ncbi:hypothetical protein HAX54_005703, partial [Datura stramonium]|nr:hypothetical protein [Datura stramonium]
DSRKNWKQKLRKIIERHDRRINESSHESTTHPVQPLAEIPKSEQSTESGDERSY